MTGPVPDNLTALVELLIGTSARALAMFDIAHNVHTPADVTALTGDIAALRMTLFDQLTTAVRLGITVGINTTTVAAYDKAVADDGDPPEPGLRVSFNPFAFTIEQNNEFLAQGYDVMPLAIPEEGPDHAQ